MAEQSDQWIKNARQWSLVGPPLRPSAEDVRVVEDALRHTRPAGSAGLRAMVLGVTPELATLRWPAATSLVSIDKSAPMIRSVWPRSGVPAGASAVHGDWRAMPLGADTRDVAVGDGSFNCLTYPDEYCRVAAELRRVLAPGGLMIMRMFVRPAVSETVDAILRDLWSGAIKTFDAFKWRLNMHLQPTTEAGVRFGDTWKLWQELSIDADALAGRLGTSREKIGAIEVYRDSKTVFTFPTVEECRTVWAADFEEVACWTPAYELGDRCPMFVMRVRG
jgi:SAM-dependent methyltransferase